MKGPSERLKYDLRRVWECPACKRRERTTGAVAFRHCSCQMKQLDGRATPMKLVVDGVQRVGKPIVIEHEPLMPNPAVLEPASESAPVIVAEASPEIPSQTPNDGVSESGELSH